MQAKLANLEAKLQEVSQQSARLTSMLAPAKALLVQHPETHAALQPMLNHLDEIDQQTRQQTDAAAKTVAELQRTQAACDSIDHAIEGLRAVTDLLDRWREPFEFASAYVSDLAKSRLPAESGEAVRKFASRVVSDAGSPLKLAADAAGLVTDAASYDETEIVPASG